MSQVPKPLASPTGSPLIPARFVPYLLALIGIVGVLIAAGAGTPPEVPELAPWAGRLGVLEGILVVLLGSTPGLRRRAPQLVALVAVSLSLSSCAHLERIGQATLDCSEPTIALAARERAPTVIDLLTRPSNEWSEQLDRFALESGSAIVVCAVKAVLAEIEARPAAAAGWTGAYLSGPDRDDALRAGRAKKWLAANGIEATR